MGQKSVQSLERALAILTHLCDRDQPIGVTELAGRLRLAKSTVHRLLSTLEEAGVVARTVDAAYRPGLKLWEIGCAAVRGLNVREAARPTMERLMRRTGETVHLSVWDQGEVVYIEKVDGTNPIRLHSTIGGRAPAHATASGLAFLAFRKPEESTEVWKKDLGRFTPRTIITTNQLEHRLDAIRRQGYAYSTGAWHSGSAGVAAPIRAHTGSLVAVLSVAGPAERIEARLPGLAALVRAAAQKISHALGYPLAQGRSSGRVQRGNRAAVSPKTGERQRSSHPRSRGPQRRRR
jgi:DNA-binding IclR family transcriptional regulator